MGQSKGVILFQSGFYLGVEVPPSSSKLGKGQRRERGPHGHDTVYLTFRRAVQPRIRLGRCGFESHSAPLPDLRAGSIVGHGRRRKQAHDKHHDWIGIRRGLCNRCGKTFTFLPPFSPPYGHYSFIARSQALQRYFLEGRCWEDAAPTVKDPDRVADPSTLRRWFRHLDSSRPPFSALRRTMLALSAWLGRTELLVHNSLPLRRHTVYPFLDRCWPLRI
jgi:hypothetical protein